MRCFRSELIVCQALLALEEVEISGGHHRFPIAEFGTNGTLALVLFSREIGQRFELNSAAMAAAAVSILYRATAFSLPTRICAREQRSCYLPQLDVDPGIPFPVIAALFPSSRQLGRQSRS